MDNYVTIYEEYKQKFFQLPKVLYTNERYAHLSNNARVVWAMLRDRASLSRKNNWYEKDTGRVYFIYTNKEMCEVTKIKSENTVTNIKKELVAVGLMEQKLRPNRPSILYLLNPVVGDNDIYEIDKLESAQHPEEFEQSQEGQGTAKIGVTKIGVPEPQKLVANNTDLSNTGLNDLDTIDTTTDFFEKNNFQTIADIEKERKKKEYMDNGYYSNTDKVPPNISKMLNVFSRTTEEAQNYYRVIIQAHQKIIDDHKFFWFIEHEPELEQIIINAFSRAIKKIEEGDIENKDGFIYRSIYNALDGRFAFSGMN